MGIKISEGVLGSTNSQWLDNGLQDSESDDHIEHDEGMEIHHFVGSGAISASKIAT